MNPFSALRRRSCGGSRIAAAAVLALLCLVSAGCLPGQDQEAGMEALRAARGSLGGEAFQEIQNLRLETKTRSRTPRGTVTLGFSMVVTPDGRFRLDRELVDGSTLTVVDDGEKMRIRSREGVQDASAGERGRITRQLWWRLGYLFVNMDRAELQVADRGTTQVNDTTYREIRVTPPEGSSFDLLLDPESMRPDRMKYTAPTARGTAEVTEVYHDFRAVGGLRLPHRTVTYRGDELTSETVFRAAETNVELEEGYFTLEGGESPPPEQADSTGNPSDSTAPVNTAATAATPEGP